MAKIGRHLKLKPDEATIGILTGLAQIQCTVKEAAAVFHVSAPTFIAFLDRNKGAMRQVWEEGKEQGKVSLRRTQWRLAQSNVPMAIFLGKNYLGQGSDSDLTITHTISAELEQLLRMHDGQQRSLPDYRPYIEHEGAGEIRQPGMANGQSLPHSQRNGSDGNL